MRSEWICSNWFVHKEFQRVETVGNRHRLIVHKTPFVLYVVILLLSRKQHGMPPNKWLGPQNYAQREVLVCQLELKERWPGFPISSIQELWGFMWQAHRIHQIKVILKSNTSDVHRNKLSCFLTHGPTSVLWGTWWAIKSTLMDSVIGVMPRKTRRQIEKCWPMWVASNESTDLWFLMPSMNLYWIVFPKICLFLHRNICVVFSLNKRSKIIIIVVIWKDSDNCIRWLISMQLSEESQVDAIQIFLQALNRLCHYLEGHLNAGDIRIKRSGKHRVDIMTKICHRDGQCSLPLNPYCLWYRSIVFTFAKVTLPNTDTLTILWESLCSTSSQRWSVIGL